MSDQTSALYLSPNQRDLLVAALNSNQPTADRKDMANKSTERKGSETPAGASATSVPSSGHFDMNDESPFLDYPLDGGDDSFNFDGEGQMFGDIPEDGAAENVADVYEHLHDKRKSLDGADEDDTGGGKRREGEDKTTKKPGRKPLTSEPTTKRKAQNRAAQRAFRERKEKHLKDLETKVEDLEKSSEATSHENAMLRAQIERLQVELKEYRKRLSWVSANGGMKSQMSNSQSRSNATGVGSSDFQFQFPKFGDSSSTSIFGGSNSTRNPPPPAGPAPRTSSLPVTQAISPAPSSISRHSVSGSAPNTHNSNLNSAVNSPMNQLTASPPSFNAQAPRNQIDSFSGLFSPSILEATRNSPNNYFGIENNQGRNVTHNSFDNSYSSVPGLYSGSSVSNTESPGSSSDSHNQISSIGTSPDPNFNSPNSMIQDFGGLNTINEEQNFMNGQTWNYNSNVVSGFDPTGFNFLNQQHGGTFDPVLFGDYRETQDNLLSQDFGSFFNEAYPLPDLGSPSHSYGDLNSQQKDQNKKTDLIAKADAAQDGSLTKAPEPAKSMTCNKIWDRLQSMEKFRNGEIDIDNLCSELRAKARCSEGGAVVEEKHVNKLLGLGM